MKTKILTIVLAVLTIGLLGSCKKENPTVSVTDVTLDKTTLTLTEGGEAQLVATIKPDNATDKNVIWLSSDNAVVTVSSDGNVTAVKTGTATIIVTTTDGSKTASCKVTVLENIDGALLGLFSVSATKKVRFSKGNLQAIFVGHGGISYSFRFAENQYDCIGDAPGNTTIDESAGRVSVDLFGWSTDSNTRYGINTSTDVADYSGNFRDWGNKIFDDKCTWRTLSKDEWTYLFNTTSRMVNSKPCYSNAVSGVSIGGTTYKGVFIYPDNYNGDVVSPSMTWEQINAAGIVFLPAAGYRDGSYVGSVGGIGNYWSSTASGETSACYVFFFYSDDVYDNHDYRNYGYSVRLITDVK